MKERIWDYHTQETQDLEFEYLFKPFWHFGCHTSEVANNRDFITLRAFDFEIIIYNDNGNIIAFYNICPHRGAKLITNESGENANCVSGNCKIKCEYHHWQFSNGKLLIPERNEFSEYGNLDLLRLKIVHCGDFIFFSDMPKMSLDEQLGEFYDELTQCSTSINHRIDINTKSRFYSNWKIGIENSIDEYHLTFVHPHSLGALELWDTPRYSSLNSKGCCEVKNEKIKKKLLKNKSLFLDSNYYEEMYFSYYLFPFSVVSSTFGYSYGIQNFFPHTPQSTHFVSRSYNVKSKIDTSIFDDGVITMNRQVFDEDSVPTNLITTSKYLNPKFVYAKKLEKRILVFQNTYNKYINGGGGVNG
ncbi:hypothetical protein CQA53_03435 [Helicobacter didelphidarum]|uniref:Rieske domain-containing protein n=1 Tax=Helicobacter didelphidarum TaxID=2040648 RepID=A0A3D8IMN1_9HELI|nr:Rieske 2Fe-2S domain-containing protein [Helicobacter didelphidarum]RDU66508.1 hypothetical protein CQA53_03435 [Helicobacter didelphidarum]